MTVVYLDAFLALNFGVNYLLLACAGRLDGEPRCRWRVALAAGLGAGYAALPLSLVWTAVWVCILLNDPVYQLISRPVWLGMLVLAAVYFCYAIGKLQTHCETLWEGTTSWL